MIYKTHLGINEFDDEVSRIEFWLADNGLNLETSPIGAKFEYHLGTQEVKVFDGYALELLLEDRVIYLCNEETGEEVKIMKVIDKEELRDLIESKQLLDSLRGKQKYNYEEVEADLNGYMDLADYVANQLKGE